MLKNKLTDKDLLYHSVRNQQLLSLVTQIKRPLNIHIFCCCCWVKQITQRNIYGCIVTANAEQNITVSHNIRSGQLGGWVVRGEGIKKTNNQPSLNEICVLFQVLCLTLHGV